MPESFVTRSGNSSMAIMPESGFVRVSEAQSSCSKRMRPCASSRTGSDSRGDVGTLAPNLHDRAETDGLPNRRADDTLGGQMPARERH